MHCRLLHDAPASGAWNMAVDEALLNSAVESGTCTLRIYGWEAPTLSLGYFQDYADREGHEASRHCPCVRRASGGGAILHDREITYCFAVPASSVWAKKHLSLYEAFHSALIDVLAARGIRASLCDLHDKQRDREQPFLCFLRRAPGDVLVDETKVAGSAQRRSAGAVVQHGSILLGRSASAPELLGINDLGIGLFNAQDLIRAWLPILAEKLAVSFRPGALLDNERDRALRIVEEKYSEDGWNRHRGRPPK